MTESLSEISNYLRKEIMGQFFGVKGRMHKKLQDLINRMQIEKEQLIHDYELKLDKMRESVSKRDYYLIKFKNLTFRMADQIAHVREKERQKMQKRQIMDAWKRFMILSKEKKHMRRLAQLHFEKREKRRILFGWYLWAIHTKQSTSEQLWHSRLESETAILRNNYELKLEEMRLELEVTKSKLAHELQEKQVLQENLRKALMRGVCAMNNKFLEIIKDTQDSNNAVNAVMGLGEYDLEEAIQQELGTMEDKSHSNPNVLTYVQQQHAQSILNASQPYASSTQQNQMGAYGTNVYNPREQTQQLFRMMSANMDAGEVQATNVKVQREIPRESQTQSKSNQPPVQVQMPRQSISSKHVPSQLSNAAHKKANIVVTKAR